MTQQVLLMQRKPQEGQQPVIWGLRLTPRVPPECPLQADSSSLGAPPRLQERTPLSACPGVSIPRAWISSHF